EPAEEELTGKGKKVARKMKNKLTLDEQEKELLASPGGQERQKQNYAEAEKLYKQALEIDAGNAQAYRGLGVLMEKMQNAQAAVDAYRRYVELKPDAMDRLQIIRRVKTLEAKLSTTDSQPSQK
ncbi:MAG TPA: tetratricopeptide repeat protein, partial [Blastocatellia bacterium]|nr:tetratricopeptide repeat protein [Blastocatellia bacterium]